MNNLPMDDRLGSHKTVVLNSNSCQNVEARSDREDFDKIGFFALDA